MEKKYRINESGIKEVAVLVSPGFGAGWSTWNTQKEELLFDSIIVDFVNAKPFNLTAFEEYLEKEYPDEYWGGIDGLCAKWIPEGSEFIIHEYDGSESLQLKENFNWITA